LDVKSTFFNDPLEENVYILQPLRFEVKGKEHHVYTSDNKFEINWRIGWKKIKDATLFKKIVGSLKFLSNISYGVGSVNRFMNNFRVPYMVALKHILRYLKGTHDHDLLFLKEDYHNETII